MAKTAPEINIANLYRRQDIRDELQILRKRIKARHQKHLQEAGDGPNAPARLFANLHTSELCTVCWNYAGQLEAIAEALRMFGGREV